MEVAFGYPADGLNIAQAAGGEVLPGTVSDAMIDLDTSTATPPLEPVRPSGDARVARVPAGDASDAASEDAPASAPAPAQVEPAPGAPSD